MFFPHFILVCDDNQLNVKPILPMIQRIRLYFAHLTVLPILETIPFPIPELPNLRFAPAILLGLVLPIGWALAFLTLLVLLLRFARYSKEKTNPDFIILILIHYRKGVALPLNAVNNDVKRLLDYLKYKHGDSTRKWYLLSDFECEYEDYTGVRRSLTSSGLPSRNVVLDTIEGAAKDGGSGLIFYGGHSLRIPREAPELKGHGAINSSTETGDHSGAKEAVCLATSDGERIYGNEIFTRLPHSSKVRKASTLTLVFDTCGAEGIAADFPDLSYLYDSKTIPKNEPKQSFTQPLQQLILVTAARVHEVASTFNNHGALTYLMTKYLEERLDASAVELVQHLNKRCERRPEKHLRQHPQIRSRYPLNGPFRLLPGTQDCSNRRSLWRFVFGKDVF